MSTDGSVYKPVCRVRLEGKRQTDWDSSGSATYEQVLCFSESHFPYGSNGRNNLFHRVKPDDLCETALQTTRYQRLVFTY